jgi:hypothetical protein
LINEKVSGVKIGMGEDRSVLTGMNGRSNILRLWAHIIMDEKFAQTEVNTLLFLNILERWGTLQYRANICDPVAGEDILSALMLRPISSFSS